MKLKILVPVSLTLITLPAITLISCSASPITPEEKTNQIFLVNEAAKKQFSPQIKLTKNIDISEILSLDDINKSIINFDNIPEANKNLSYEILNFEIPPTGVEDIKVNVKVSSKLDSSIFEEYSFKTSSAIDKNGFTITPLTKQLFQEAINKVYFNLNIIEIQNVILRRINDASTSLDISKEVLDNSDNVVKNILDIPSQKNKFIEEVQNIISSVVLTKLNNIAKHSNIKVDVVNIQANKSDPNKLRGIISVNIIFGENNADNTYLINPFLVDTFSNNYLDLKNKINLIKNEVIKPTLLLETPETVINIVDLNKNLYIEIPKSLDPNDDFIISVLPFVIGANPASDTDQLTIEIFSKKYNSHIITTYQIKIKDIINYAPGKINFVPSIPKIKKEVLWR